ncbi:hypothetical protein QJS04_geneDACA011160 [Acorus gramineus]|uniref:Uncharacterized protein n=1 Tax=Acorus gramineus TaxID=55184 RepID=A0AAV9BIK8_ACOGR|nr:hypothetical protein QJS04_geneDACA011160 [Acorus gramineus]
MSEPTKNQWPNQSAKPTSVCIKQTLKTTQAAAKKTLDSSLDLALPLSLSLSPSPTRQSIPLNPKKKPSAMAATMTTSLIKPTKLYTSSSRSLTTATVRSSSSSTPILATTTSSPSSSHPRVFASNKTNKSNKTLTSIPNPTFLSVSLVLHFSPLSFPGRPKPTPSPPSLASLSLSLILPRIRRVTPPCTAAAGGFGTPSPTFITTGGVTFLSLSALPDHH